MTRKTMFDLGADTVDIAAAFFLRNGIVLSLLTVTLLVALAR